MKPGTTVENVNKNVAEIEALVANDEDLDYYLLTYGASGLSISGGDSVSITAYLKDDRKRSTNRVINEWMEEAAYMENVTISMDQGSSTGSTMTGGRQIEVDLQSTDYDALREETNRLADELRKRDDVIQVHSSVENAAPILRVNVDPVKAQAEG